MMYVKKTQLIGAALGLLVLASCSKSSSKSTPTPPPVNTDTTAIISNASPLSGNVSGTMGSGKTYTLGGDITVPVGDTRTIRSGLTIKIPGTYDIIGKGSFTYLATQSAPNWITSGTPRQAQAF